MNRRLLSFDVVLGIRNSCKGIYIKICMLKSDQTNALLMRLSKSGQWLDMSDHTQTTKVVLDIFP